MNKKLKAKPVMLFLYGPLTVLLLIVTFQLQYGGGAFALVTGLGIGGILGGALGWVFAWEMNKRIEENVIRGVRGKEWIPYSFLFLVLWLSPWISERACRLIEIDGAACSAGLIAIFDGIVVGSLAILFYWILKWEREHKQPLHIQFGWNST